MTPEEFVAKWKLTTLGERQAAQPHFHDLCDLLGEPRPGDADPSGTDYCFEKGAQKTSGRRGFADVWKRGHFAWEYKGKGANLADALSQLQQYALALQNPPLLVVCDLDRFLVVTNWTNTVSARWSFPTDELRDPKRRQLLKDVLSNPDALKPGLTREQLTAERARRFAELARDLRAKGHDPARVARFLVRLAFCMFAEDVGLLNDRMLQRMLEAARRRPDRSEAYAEQLFRTMADGGDLDFEPVLRFNGGLFDTTAGEPLALPLDRPEIERALAAAKEDWAEVDPSIMGTLFVQGLDPKRLEDLFRSTGGKGFEATTFRRRFEQYTDRDKIMLILDPVIRRPLEAEWATARAAIEQDLAAAATASPKARAEAQAAAQGRLRAFTERLGRFRVLDPACGSGNFLYLALKLLKDLEHRAGLEAEALGLRRDIFSAVGPHQLLGIEINPFAVEIARASVWIGDIQWRREQGFPIDVEPVLTPLDTIECRDALVNPDGSQASWPECDVIVGNPPFLGVKLMQREMGVDYTAKIRSAYTEIPAFSDLVCYWFTKAFYQIDTGSAYRAGLVSTNSIRGGLNRSVLDNVVRIGMIFDAWSDEAWNIEGASVRVSLVSFTAKNPNITSHLNGQFVGEIQADLTSTGNDLSRVLSLKQNAQTAYNGIQKSGPFDVLGVTARAFLAAATNPNGSSNRDVVKPYWNGLDLVKRPRDRWLIDFTDFVSVQQATFYEAPFAYLAKHVQPHRYEASKKHSNPDSAHKMNDNWWLLWRPRREMRGRICALPRFIVTNEVSKFRVFGWLPASVLPDKQLIVVARDDDTTFGILHSRLHEVWSLRLGTWLGVGNDPRYTPTTCFETFPFPEGLTPDIPAAAYALDPRARRIATIAARLHELREAWLNPPEWVRREPEVVPGYPDRLLPVDEAAARELKQRTLTNLYNQRPAWLDRLHRDLDAAVAAAYGWPEDLADDAILQRLFTLNQERAAAQRNS